MTTTIGKLRHRVTIQRDAGAISDTTHEWVESWATLASVYASIEGTGGGESDKPSGRDAVRGMELRIRYRSDVTADMRVIFGTRTLHVTSVEDREGRRRWLWLVCGEDV